MVSLVVMMRISALMMLPGQVIKYLQASKQTNKQAQRAPKDSTEYNLSNIMTSHAISKSTQWSRKICILKFDMESSTL